MKYYKIVKTKRFIRLFEKLDNSIQERFNILISALKEDPYIGKPLNREWFRELKVNKYRLYYLIYENNVTVLLVSTSNKKEQQKEIDFIRTNIAEFGKNINNGDLQ